MKKNNKGFTLVELIVVLVILAILAAILVPTLLGYIDRARSEKDFSTAQTVRVAAQAAIDQAYGDGKLADGTGNITTIEAMDGKISAGAKGSGGNSSYAETVYTLSGVDTGKVTAFEFNYTDGIITGGTVTINSHTYKLDGGAWSAS